MHRKTRFGPRIHILWGPNAEDTVLFLAIESGQVCIGSSHLTGGFAGEGDLWLTILRDALSESDDRPLFICNFLERLDEAVDLHPIFEALHAAGRQVFIAVPHYYNIEKLEELCHGATIQLC